MSGEEVIIGEVQQPLLLLLLSEVSLKGIGEMGSSTRVGGVLDFDTGSTGRTGLLKDCLNVEFWKKVEFGDDKVGRIKLLAIEC